MKVIKRKIPVSVQFARHPGKIETLEGPVFYEAGDALLTGVSGERWPVSRKSFDASYLPVAPLNPGENGGYIKRPITVDAIQVAEPTTIILQAGNGVLHATAGDWIVTAPDGNQWVVADSIFQQTYQAAPP